MVLERERMLSITLLLIWSVTTVGMCQGQGPVTPGATQNSFFSHNLDFWNGVRAYPNPEIPAGAHTTAFASVKRQMSNQLRTDIEWESMGPVNIAGRMLSIAVNPQNPNTVYAGSASGGLWRSRTGGKGPDAWEPVTTGFPVYAASCIAFHPADSNIIVVGTGEVYNYQAAGTGNVVWRTRGTYGIGILMSTDGGQSWTQSLDWAYTNLRGVNKVLFDPHDPNRIYAATTEGVYLSPDLGGNWFRMLNKKMVTDIAMHPTQPGLILAAAGNLKHPDRGIYRSTDGGGIWTKTGPAVEFLGKIMLGNSAAAPDTVFATIGLVTDGSTDLTISPDFGLTWQPAGDLVVTNGWFAHEVAVAPADPGNVLVGGFDVWKYRPATDQFARQSDWQKGSFAANAPGTPDGPSDFVHQNIHDIVFDPSDPSRVFFATDGGIYLSEDGGNTFTNANGHLQTAQFYPGVSSDPKDSTFFLGGLQNNGTAIYEGNSSWRRVIGGEGGYTAIDPRSGSTIFVGSPWLQTSKSYNRGLSFTDAGVPAQSFNSANFVAPFVMAPGHPERMYFGGSAMYRTDDLGGTVMEVSNGDLDSGRKVIAIAVSHQNKNKLYVSTSPLTQGSLGNILVAPPASILKSEDGGATWTKISEGLPDRMSMDLAVDPWNDEVLYAVMSGFGTSHVYKSTDGGNSWTAMSNGLPDVPLAAITIDPHNSDHVYIGGDLGAWLSQDGGQNWELLTGDLGDPFMVTDLSISDANRKLRMATFGRGMMEMPMVYDGPATAIRDQVAGFGVQVTPNPSKNGRGVITLAAPLQATASVELLSLEGRQIKAWPEAIRPGVTEFAIDTDNLPAGMYLLSIRSGERQEVKKWVTGKY